MRGSSAWAGRIVQTAAWSLIEVDDGWRSLPPPLLPVEEQANVEVVVPAITRQPHQRQRRRQVDGYGECSWFRAATGVPNEGLGRWHGGILPSPMSENAVTVVHALQPDGGAAAKFRIYSCKIVE